MSDIRQLLLNPRKRVKLDNGRTACTSAEEDEAVPRPNIAEASGLAAPVDDDDDLLQDVIERQHGAFTPSKSIVTQTYTRRRLRSLYIQFFNHIIRL